MNVDQLMQKYTPEEIADAMILPVKLTAKQNELAAKQLAEHRNKRRSEMTAEEKLQVKLLQLKFRLEDYLDNDLYEPKFTFGYFLEQYLELTNKKKKDFAHDIQIHETQLSNIIKDRREPNESIFIRLELHSHNTIPAIDWFKLTEKTKGYKINNNAALRAKESKYVIEKLAV